MLPRYALSALLFLALAEVLLFLRFPIALDYFYILAWWPYIILADGLVYKYSGWSPITSRSFAFLLMLPWSVSFWLIFEIFNLRLENWRYVELVKNPFLRWPGYTLAYATVLPGLFETYCLARVLGIASDLRTRRFEITPRLECALVAAGVVFLLLPVIWPKYFFPLVWGGFVLLVDPVNARLKGVSLLKDLSEGRPQRIIHLLVAGLVCGFLWEFWNYWARSKWIYTVPYVGEIKLFEMPILGFLGFPPFALECYVMYHFVVLMGWARPWEPETGKKGLRWHHAAIVAAQIPFWAGVYSLIDRYTVISFH